LLLAFTRSDFIGFGEEYLSRFQPKLLAFTWSDLPAA